MWIDFLAPFSTGVFGFEVILHAVLRWFKKNFSSRHIQKRPGRTYNSLKVLSGPKSEVKYGGRGITCLLVEEAQVKKKISRIVSSQENNGLIDTTRAPIDACERVA